MAFTVQADDGTTAGANAYITLTEFQSYHTDRGNDFSSYDDQQVQFGIVRGTSYVDTRFRYKGVKLLGATAKASGTLNVSANFNDADVIVIGNATYTLQMALTNVAGNVQIGESDLATIQNLVDAINGSGNPGTEYAAATQANQNVTADSANTAVTVTAKNPGFMANSYVTTTTSANAAWGASTLTGGVGPQSTQWPRCAPNDQFTNWFDLNFLTPMLDVNIGIAGSVPLIDANQNPLSGIPQPIKDACSEYALRALSILLWQDAPAPVGGRLIREISQSVDVIKQQIQYEPQQSGSFALPVFPAADMILSQAGIIQPARTLYR